MAQIDNCNFFRHEFEKATQLFTAAMEAGDIEEMKKLQKQTELSNRRMAREIEILNKGKKHG